ncbi:MAG: helix-turn-helix domain-containing protein [Endomicrobia bacterium]|nr:helix-turn-helix domain-containing protein [Endomicrobiia bacterium]MCL2799363.1 helix-turn-helix domain-containing protein [Endomicrobiia bacterium]
MENKNINSNKQIMDIKELSEYLGIGKSKIYSLIKMKKIPASKIGRQYRFSKDIVDSWLRDKIVTKKEDGSQNEKNVNPENSGENK